MGVSRCFSDYARLPSVARLSVCIYIEILEECKPYYEVANLVTVTKTNMTDEMPRAYGQSWPQRHSARVQWETDRARRNTESSIGGRYGTRRIVSVPGAEQSATGVSLTARTDRVHSDDAIPPGRNCLLVMYIITFQFNCRRRIVHHRNYDFTHLRSDISKLSVLLH